MFAYVALYAHNAGDDYASRPVHAATLTEALRLAANTCEPGEMIVGIWRKTVDPTLIEWHARQHNPPTGGAYRVEVSRDLTQPGWPWIAHVWETAGNTYVGCEVADTAEDAEGKARALVRAQAEKPATYSYAVDVNGDKVNPEAAAE